ncbi:MAG: hypothetical protein ABIM49_00965 [candidate division WOR-3 bacterium]
MKKIILIIIPFYLFSGTYDYLKIPASSKESALLNLLGLFEKYPSALFVNPSGIFEVERMIEAGYGNYIVDMHQGYLTFPIGKSPTFWILIRFLHLGKFTKTDTFGNEIGEYNGENLSISFCFPITQKYKIGGSFELLYNILDKYSSLGTALSFGYNFYERKVFKDALWRNSFTLKYIGFEIKPFNKERSTFPLKFTYSSGLKFSTFETGFSLFYIINEGINGEISYLYRWGKNLRISISYTTYNRDTKIGEGIKELFSGFSSGMGIEIKKINLFYSYTPFGVFGDIHRIDISYKF